MKKELVKIILTATCLFLSATAHAIVIDGKDWRQLTETVGFSYNELSAIYDTSTGQLDTSVRSLRGVDFEGWTWASMADVGELFNVIVNEPSVDFSNPLGALVRQYGSSWGPAAIDADGPANADDGYFLPVYEVPGQAMRLDGITRTQSIYDAGNAFFPIILDEFNDGLEDDAATTTHGAKWLASQHRGVWLYRTAEGVPEPTTLALLGLGLAGLGVSRQWRRASLTRNASVPVRITAFLLVTGLLAPPAQAVPQYFTFETTRLIQNSNHDLLPSYVGLRYIFLADFNAPGQYTDRNGDVVYYEDEVQADGDIYDFFFVDLIDGNYITIDDGAVSDYPGARELNYGIFFQRFTQTDTFRNVSFDGGGGYDRSSVQQPRYNAPDFDLSVGSLWELSDTYRTASGVSLLSRFEATLVNVSTTNPISEPTTLTLLGIALAGFGYNRRRWSQHRAPWR